MDPNNHRGYVHSGFFNVTLQAVLQQQRDIVSHSIIEGAKYKTKQPLVATLTAAAIQQISGDRAQ